MGDKKDMLKDYATPYPTPQKKAIPQLVPKKKPYRAVEPFKTGKSGERFRLVDKEGGFDFYQFTHLIEGSYRKEMLTLVMTSRSFVLSGRNLDQLVDEIDNRKAKALHTFNPEIHEEPADESAIVITDIEKQD